MVKTILKAKSKALSVQSIIIGSVISGIIASAGLSMMWPSVDAAKVQTEQRTINAINLMIGTYRSNHGGLPTNIGHYSKLMGYVQQLPNDFKYALIRSLDNSGTGTDGQGKGGIIAISKDTSASETNLKSIIIELEKRFDQNGNKVIGTMGYENDCTRDWGCFYSVELSSYDVNDPIVPLWGVIVNTRNVAGTEHVTKTILGMNKGQTLHYVHGGYDRQIVVLN